MSKTRLLISALSGLGAVLPITAQAQDTPQRTEESAQAFLAQTLSGWKSDPPRSSTDVYQWSMSNFARIGRCESSFDWKFVDYAPSGSGTIMWRNVIGFEHDETQLKISIRKPIPTNPDNLWRVFLMAPRDFSPATVQRMAAAITFLVETCDASRSTGF